MSAMKIKAGSEHEKERNKNTKRFQIVFVDCARDDCNCRDCAIRIGDDARGADAPRHPARQIGVYNRFLAITRIHLSQPVLAPFLADWLYLSFFSFFGIRPVSTPFWLPNPDAIISNPIRCGNRQKRFTKGVCNWRGLLGPSALRAITKADGVEAGCFATLMRLDAPVSIRSSLGFSQLQLQRTHHCCAILFTLTFLDMLPFSFA